MAFCVACGSGIGDSAKFCPACGASTPGARQAAVDYAETDSTVGVPPIIKFIGLGAVAIALLGAGYWFFANTPDPGADTNGDGFLTYDEVQAELDQRVLLRYGRWQISASVKETTRANVDPREWSRELQQVERQVERIRNIDSCVSWDSLEGLNAGGRNDLLELLNSSELSLLNLNLGRGDTLVETREDASLGQGSLIKNRRITGTMYEEAFDLRLETSVEGVDYGSSVVKSYGHAIEVSAQWTGDCY